MNTCPKCGSDKIRGPFYDAGYCAKTHTYGEHLDYYCLICCYAESQRPKDFKEAYKYADAMIAERSRKVEGK